MAVAAQPAQREESLDPPNVVRLASAQDRNQVELSQDVGASSSAGVEHASSHVRARGPNEPFERALERVGEYLRALGLIDQARIQTLALEVCQAELEQGYPEARLPER